MSENKICVLGQGYVGLTLAATLADSGFTVLGIDSSKTVIENLNKGKVSFFETGLEEVLHKVVNKKLFFQNKITDNSCNYYMISVGTPIDRTNNSPKLEFVTEAVKSIVPFLKKSDTVILRSTVPVGTSRNLAINIIEKQTNLKIGKDIFFGFVPERTVEGKALEEQKNIPQILGAFNDKSKEKIIEIFGKFNKNIVEVTDMEHAELCKIIDNTYRDVNFAYANQIAMICEHLGLNYHVVRNACNKDYKRNNIAAPSPGVGGSCLTKDPYILMDLCKKLDISVNLIEAARAINENFIFHLAKKILHRLNALGKNINSAKILIMGFAFKGDPETSDMRFSTTIDLVNYLKPFCTHIYGYDGVVPKNEIEALGVSVVSIEDGFKDADVVVIMNTHKSHKNLDLNKLSALSNDPLIFIDCWNIYKSQDFKDNPKMIFSGVGVY